MPSRACCAKKTPPRTDEAADPEDEAYSTISDSDFLEFSEWDSEFNRPGEPGEVPPPALDVRPVPVVSSDTDKCEDKSVQKLRQPNGRLGCKRLANLQQQLLKEDKNQRRDLEDTSVEIVAPPLKRQCCVASPSAVAGVIAGIQMSHPRHGCMHHPFECFDSTKRDVSWTDRTEKNKKYCPMCYCFVCEVKADECPDFERHCNANDRDDMKSYWKFQRSKKQEENRNRHFRFQCAVHIFRHSSSACPWPVEMWEQRSWFNKRFCRECVCFVCNKPVIDCADWSEHCELHYYELNTFGDEPTTARCLTRTFILTLQATPTTLTKWQAFGVLSVNVT